MNIFSKVWDTLRYSLYQYGVLVQNDADKNFLYDIALPKLKGLNRMVDCLSYKDYDTWEDVVEAAPFIGYVDPDNPPKRLCILRPTHPSYKHVAGDTFVRVPLSFKIIISVTALNNLLDGENGHVTFYCETSEFPYSSVALPPKSGVPYSGFIIPIDGLKDGETVIFFLSVKERIAPSYNEQFFRLIGIDYDGPFGSVISVSFDIPKLTGESVWPQGRISGPGTL